MATGILPPPPPHVSYRIEKLNPMAFPKGMVLSCDLTGKPAQYSLISDCITLRFVSRETAKQAWDGILCKIAHVLGPLNAEAPMANAEERARRAQVVHACNTLLFCESVLNQG